MDSKMIRYLVVGFLFLIFSSSFRIATSQDSLSLTDAIRTGLENNFQVRIMQEYSEMARINNSWGTVGRYPSLNIGANSINRYDDIPSRIIPDTRDKYYTNILTPFVWIKLDIIQWFCCRYE